MRTAELKRAGEMLGRAWLTAEPLADFPDNLRARSREEAYAVQDAMAEVIDQPVLGWKLGATSPVMRALAGHDGAIIGRIFDSTADCSPARLPASRYRNSRAECEFAFRLLADLPARAGGYGTAELSEVATLHLAVEIIGNRYPRTDVFARPGTNDEIADNGAGIGFVFGPEVPRWRKLDLPNIVIDIRVDGGPTGENLLGEGRCPPILSLVQATEILGARGIDLHANQYVSTGAATNPLPLADRSTVEAVFADLGRIDITFDPAA